MFSIITQIKDFYLRNSVLNVLFDELLSPSRYENTEELVVLDRFNTNIAGAGEFVHHYGNENYCSQYERDMYLSVSILQLILNNKELGGSFNNQFFRNIGDLIDF